MEHSRSRPSRRPGKAQGSQGEAFASDSSAIMRIWKPWLTTVLDLRHMNVQIIPQSEGRVSDFPTPATREARRERPSEARDRGLEATVLDLGRMGQASLTIVLDLRHMNVQIPPQSEGRVSDLPTPATREACRELQEPSPGEAESTRTAARAGIVEFIKGIVKKMQRFRAAGQTEISRVPG